MKNIFLASVFCLTFISLTADITSNLESYTQIECVLKERDMQSRERYRPSPNIQIEKGISTNWSGYASMSNLQRPSNGSVSSVSGSWVVPQLLATSDDTCTAIWVGIDGYNSKMVEQIGTEHDWVEGEQQNSVWFEMYPNPSYSIDNFSVSVGDVIEAEVVYKGHNQFQLSIVNHTQNTYAIVPGELTKSLIARRSSAEWIVEAPYSSEILPLSDFQKVYFTECKTTINKVTGGIAHKGWQADALTMASSTGEIKATPSDLNYDDTGFSVTWMNE